MVEAITSERGKQRAKNARQVVEKQLEDIRARRAAELSKFEAMEQMFVSQLHQIDEAILEYETSKSQPVQQTIGEAR